jgi:hypothetical protein
MAQRSSRGILPLNPLRNDCVRPAEGALSRPELICSALPGVGFESLVGWVQPASFAALLDRMWVSPGLYLRWKMLRSFPPYVISISPGRVDNAQLVHQRV